MTTATEKLAQQIAAIRRQLAAQRVPQLPNSSIDNGSLTLVTGGQVSGSVGTQFDGTTGSFTLAGPTPPAPSQPILTTHQAGVVVTWDGTYPDQSGFTSPVVAPMDFARVEIQVADNLAFTGATMTGSIGSAAGGDVFIAWPVSNTPLYARLFTRSTAGKRSLQSVIGGPTPSGQVQLGDLGFNISDYAGGSTIYYGSATPSAPAGGFKTGDLWLHYLGDSTGASGQPPAGTPLYETKRWSGSAWVLVQDQGISTSLAAAIAAQSTANAANSLASAAQTTANGKITAFYQATAPTSGMSTGDFWLDTANGNRLSRYSGSAWVVTQDVAIQTALTNAGTAQATADGKARIFAQTTAPTGMVAGDVGDLWIDTTVGNGNKMYTWSGSAWVAKQLGNGAIAPNSLIASNVIATGTVTAALMESVMVLATTVAAGPVSAAHVELSAAGLLTYDTSPDGGLQNTGGFGTGDDGISFVDPATGETTVSLDRSGAGAIRTLSVSGVDNDGDGTIDGGLVVYGRDLLDWLTSGSQGLVASGFLSNAASGIFASGITAALGLGEITFTNDPARQYLVIFSGLHFGSTVANDRVLVTVRGTTDGSTPTVSNGTIYASSFLNIPVANQAFTAPPVIVNGTFASTVAPVRLLVTAQRFSGTGSVTAYTYASTNDYVAPFRLFAIDCGPNIADTYIPNDGGGVRSGGNPVVTGKQNYVSTWGPSFVGAYLGSGAKRTDTPDLVQGNVSVYPANGNEKSIVGFTGNAISGETTKTVTSALSGATVTKVEIYAYAYHTYYNSGGTAQIGYHGNTSAPSTAPAASYGAFSNAFFAKGQGRWMTLPSSTFASWASGTYRGYTVGPGTTSANDYYLRFYGTGSLGPRLRISYTR